MTTRVIPVTSITLTTLPNGQIEVNSGVLEIDNHIKQLNMLNNIQAMVQTLSELVIGNTKSNLDMVMQLLTPEQKVQALKQWHVKDDVRIATIELELAYAISELRTKVHIDRARVNSLDLPH